MNEITLSTEGVSPVDFYGVNNSKFEQLKATFPRLKILSRGNHIKAIGNENELDDFKSKVESMLMFLEKYGKLSEADVADILKQSALAQAIQSGGASSDSDVLVYGPHGYVVKAKTENQRKLVAMSDKNDILFAIGPAGTGKTYTAVALAVRALKARLVRKIILTRPAVEAGENLGFLPGDLKEKIDPYLRPLYDALDDMIPSDKLQYFMTNRVIEVAPLAFMRGRTLDNAFIILDEAQNTTDAQLKMFLTRIGPSAKCIITGDMTQIDLPKYQRSGLVKGLRILENIDGIGILQLDEKDVIRHRLVKKIILAYNKDDEKNPDNKEADPIKRLPKRAPKDDTAAPKSENKDTTTT